MKNFTKKEKEKKNPKYRTPSTFQGQRFGINNKKGFTPATFKTQHRG